MNSLFHYLTIQTLKTPFNEKVSIFWPIKMNDLSWHGQGGEQSPTHHSKLW